MELYFTLNIRHLKMKQSLYWYNWAIRSFSICSLIYVHSISSLPLFPLSYHLIFLCSFSVCSSCLIPPVAQWKPIISSCPSAHTHTLITPSFFLPHSHPLHLSNSVYLEACIRLLLTDSCVYSVVYLGDSSSSRCVWGGGGERGINMLLGDGESPSYYLLATYIKWKGLPRKPTSCVMLYACSVLCTVCNVNSGHLLCCAANNNDQLLLLLIKPSTDAVIIP